MAINPIDPIKMTQAALPMGVEGVASSAKTDNAFDGMLSKAIDALNDVSATEVNANNLIDAYAAGKAELSDVMIATAKMTVAVQFAVTAITSAVNTFKEITQIAI